MNNIKLDEIGRLILKYYSEPIKEKYELPREKRIITKTIEVEEPVLKNITTSVLNPIPGIAIIIVSVIAGIVLFNINFNEAIFLSLFGIIGGVAALIFIKKKKTVGVTVSEKVKKTVEEEVELPPEYAYKDIPQKYSINSIGKINLKFYLSNIRGGNLIIPESDSVSKREFKFPTLNKYKAFKKEDSLIEDQTESIPFVLDGEAEEQPLDIETTYGKKVILRGYEKNLNAYFQNTEDVFSNIKKNKIEIPIIQDEKLSKYLVKSDNQFGFGIADYFSSLINSEQGYELEDFMTSWIEQWTSRMLLMNRVRINSLQNEVSPEFLELGQISQYTSFNFYCPDCNKEIQNDLLSRDYSIHADSTPNEIYFSKNTRCKFNPVKNTWKCPLCNNSFKQPIPIHKVMDEIFLPLYDNLMEENKVEREKHHSEMRKKEIEMSYKMKEELEKIYFEHISGIFELQSNMDTMQAEVEGESEAIYYMEDIARKQKDIHSNVINNILVENREMNRQVKEQAERVTKQMEDFKNAELNKYDEEMNVLSEAKRIEDERRHSETTGLLNDINKTTKQGFENVVSEQQKTTSAVQENTQAVQETTIAVNENTEIAKDLRDATKKGFDESNKKLAKGNAIHMARAKKDGDNLRDEAGWRIDKRLSHAGSDLVGALSGRSLVDTELAKDN